MKIKKLEYYDEEYQWKLEAVEFSPNFNLLVGVSGAGKTRILEAIRNLKAIANGASLNGVKWSISFSAKNNNDYYWSGKFETKDSSSPIDSESNQEEYVKIIHETLRCNEDTVIQRNENEIIFNGVKTPKLSPFESVIELLKQEDIISPIKEELDRIILTDSEQSFDKIWRLPISLFKKYEKSSLLTIKESELPIPVKLAILYRILPNEFEKIKQAFISIFNHVLDIKIEPLKDEDIPINLSDLLKEATIVRIKEKGVEDWIQNISSGMFKTLMYISQLYLSPDDCVILIDEFENSLGVNCIDSVTELIVNHQKSQFIITSHHPYIINNISPVYWKIVTRQGGLVTVKTAKYFHISESRQKGFIDLINVLQDEDEDSED
ncbi:MAG: AAA family ATPase [Oscillatoria sp. SIO1A7]|nr:AAA family ATPase [Oscillatoria sp. SIO1A7]